ncbi:MAG: Holliday junction resolvase RuvX [Paludibacter sp.]|nr:Holliday junction resolvase RuvX [Bacteroidales bacterium]MCM1069059.1 Holliday junction resolvase RuvX [Prevotella sp.]MCM1353498.1 Holliday junction resolvase RuvX [Bacteroides sp.]MCM1442659.1 Holliday junction resolvase RuvX [Muribaculum sp.]MCM1481704.1 Holliday junction resolvase RuvX [Paludibacter sp.]
MGRILAIDYGRKRTGIAVTDPLRIIAQPLETIPTHTLLDWLDTYFRKEMVDTVVIGHPKQMNNEDSETMPDIRVFIKHFRSRFPERQILLFDERFTSVLAHQAMLDGGMKRKQRQDKNAVDKIAAAFILESYMQSLERGC